MNPEDLAPVIDYRFNDAGLLTRALTHRSYGPLHNERLEFLGDSVLNCAIALELYQKFPDLTEGLLSRLRANLVNQSSLVSVATELKLGDHVRLGEGEIRSGGIERPSILADTVEALVGAVFLDGGFEAARAVVRRLFGTPLGAIDPETSAKDPKTRLQEYLQSRHLALPQYGVVATRGEAHQHVFQVQCFIPELNIKTVGEGTSRRNAEQNAARDAYALLTGE